MLQYSTTSKSETYIRHDLPTVFSQMRKLTTNEPQASVTGEKANETGLSVLIRVIMR